MPSLFPTSSFTERNASVCESDTAKGCRKGHKVVLSVGQRLLHMDPRTLKIIDLIKHDCQQNLSLNKMAQAVNLSPWSLCHMFKKDTRFSPVQYVRRLRMQEAKELLETTFLSVKEVMTKVGVHDESHFVRDFEKVHGLSPVRYRTIHNGLSTQISKIG
jgi:transcriptional regulator GlxA family with amidase domain